MDGQIGTYLGLTGKQLKGYEVFRAGMATHFVPSDRLEALEERLCALEFDTASPSTSETGKKAINAAIEEFVADASIAQSSSSVFTGPIREVLDSAFKHPRVPAILESLEAAKAKQPELSGWIDETIAKLNFVSPTSLSVALQAIRDGKDLDINATFERDLHLASIFCVSHFCQCLRRQEPNVHLHSSLRIPR